MNKYKMTLSKIEENSEKHLFDFEIDFEQFNILRGLIKYWTIFD
jgi:hypothetical protein